MSDLSWTLWHFDGMRLAPHAMLDLEILAERYAPGTRLRAKFAQPRSLPHHRLYFAVLHEVVQATGQWPTIDDLHEAIKLELRMVRGVRLLSGEVRYLTASISFHSMDQGTFRVFFDRAMEAIHNATGIDTQALIAAAKVKGGMEKEDYSWLTLPRQ